MSLSTIVQAVTTAAFDFAGHTGSTPPRSYFGGPIHIDGADEDPWEGMPHHDLERVRARLAAQPAERAERLAAQRFRMAELRALRLAGASA